MLVVGALVYSISLQSDCSIFKVSILVYSVMQGSDLELV